MTNAAKQFGATYDTNPGEDFGKITGIFPVGADWDGHRYHGYCIPTEDEIKAYFVEVQ